jgi:hypothetical protein
VESKAEQAISSASPNLNIMTAFPSLVFTVLFFISTVICPAASLTDSAAAPWKKDFKFVEKMNIYDFPEQQINYQIELPAGIEPGTLTLLSVTDPTVTAIPFQLSDKKSENGALQMTLSFRTDLPKGQTRWFRLVSGFPAAGVPPTTVSAPTLKPAENPNEAVLGNDLLLVKVPAGHQEFAGGKPLSQVPGPILGLARAAQPQPWMVTSSFAAPETLLVTSVDAKLVESGPIFARYEITYQFQNDKSYTMDLELRAGESHVFVAESVHGFTPDDQAFLHLNYGRGLLDPDTRIALANTGQDQQIFDAKSVDLNDSAGTSLAGHLTNQLNAYSGAYDRDVTTNESARLWPRTLGWMDYDPKIDDSKEGRLNYRLGIYMPNQAGIVHGTTFYQDKGTDGLVLAVDRLNDWKTYQRWIWDDFRSTDNLRFFSQDGRKYMATGLAGEKRFWVAGLIPRAEVVLRAQSDFPKGRVADPATWLADELNLWNLDDYKNILADWPETLDAAPFNTTDATDFQNHVPFVPMAYDAFKARYIDRGPVHELFDFGPNMGGLGGRGWEDAVASYALSRASWTPEQRELVRQVLVFFADYLESDASFPHHSMMGGHPNFIMDAKPILPVMAAAFPNNPQAKFWRDSFMGFYNEWLDVYDRKDKPEINNKGGRWTENISCYVGQCFVGLATSQFALQAYDGTSLGKNPQMLMLVRWMRDSFMSPQDGVRLIPPEGAHSTSFDSGQDFRKTFFALCADLVGDDPQLAQEMKWIETNGQEGKKPDLHSALYTDYGPVFRYDFGGPNESYAHMQNINGLSYRWHGAGVLFYGAKGKVWSYHTREADGDEFTWDEISAFNVKEQGLAAGPTDQLLYDFDFAQFYRQPGHPGDDYAARGVMLLRDDYLVVSDEVKSPDVAGTFNWASVFDMPQIYQLKPGAPEVDKISRDPEPPRKDTPVPTGQVRSYSGSGDFLTVVAPAAVTAKATPFGGTVNGEYVFASQQPENITEGPASFSGTYGYARPNQLALFQGDKIGLNGFELRREGGDFGASAVAGPDKITGRIVGRSGGKISVVPPAGMNVGSANVVFDGKPIAHVVEKGAVTFSFDIAQKDGLKNYQISF